MKRQQEADKLGRTVFVGNLPAATPLKSVKALFKAYGKVESARLRSVSVDADGKMPRRGKVITKKFSAGSDVANAYVVFASAESAEMALAHNMQVYGGRHLRVDRAAAPAGKSAGPVEYDKTRTVFVGHLPFDASEDEVVGLFESGDALPELRGAVEAVRLVRDRKTGKGKGIAFVLLRSAAAVRVAIGGLHGAEMRGQTLRVSRVSNKEAAKAAAAKQKEAREQRSAESREKRKQRSADEAEAREAKRARRNASEQAPWEGTKTRPDGRVRGARGPPGTQEGGFNVEKVRSVTRKQQLAPKPKNVKQGAKLTKHGTKAPKAASRVSGRKRPAVAARKKLAQAQARGA